MVIKNFGLINLSRRWEIDSNLFSKALKSGFKSYWKHWSVQGLHTPLKMLIINIAVRCTSLYLQKIKNYFKINKTRFYQKYSTSFSRPPCRGFLNHVSIHGFLAIMTCWYLFICISFTLFFYKNSFVRTLRLKYLHGVPRKQIVTDTIPYHDLFFKISKM